MTWAGGQLAIMFQQFGPYHYAKLRDLELLVGSNNLISIEIADKTAVYSWRTEEKLASQITLFPHEKVENISSLRVFLAMWRVFRSERPAVYFSPSYSPAPIAAALFAAWLLGIKTVMMNDSHAGSSRAHGIAAFVKRLLVQKFDAALVAGVPQIAYFSQMGLSSEHIFPCYDVVDNDYFCSRSFEIRKSRQDFERKFRLPKHYFLSVCRFVEIKNLPVLIEAYARFCELRGGDVPHLVIVGDGPDARDLKEQCKERGLRVYDQKMVYQFDEGSGPSVHFPGFRQIDEGAVYYALADALILPSRCETWGLVVNEAMATGLPVVVSDTVGCLQDLLGDGEIITPAGARCHANGYSFPHSSADALTECLEHLFSSEERREEMGRMSQELIKRFSCREFSLNALRAANAALERNRFR